MKIDNSTEVLGLIGNPVEDSLSPMLHNRAIKKLGLDYRYFAFNVDKGSVDKAIVGARELGFKGLNITVPHKETAVEYVDDLSRSARIMGAINTVTFKDDGRVQGSNTDWRGFLESLELHEFDPEGQNCLVFGAGGAAAGVVYGLVRKGAKRIVIVNRTEAKGVELAGKVEGLSPGVNLEVRPLSGSDIGKKVNRSDLVVNATSVGMGKRSGQTIWGGADFHSGQLVYDLVYKPSPTEFLKLAGKAGASTIGGLDMLIIQGLESLKKWTGKGFGLEKFVPELREYLKDSGGF